MSRFRNIPPIALLSLLCIYVVWGSTYLAIRIALDSLPPFFLVGSRFVTAGIILYVIARLRGVAPPTRIQWRNAGIVGILLLAGGNAGTALAEEHIASSMSAIIVASAPIWNALAMGLYREWPTRFEWLGIGIGLAGVLALSTDGELRADPIGVIIQLVGINLWSLGSAFGRKLELPPGGMGYAAEMLIGGTVCFALSLLRGEQLNRPLLPESAVAWVYLTIVGSIIAFSAYMIVIKNLRPALSSSYAYVNPIVAIGLGVAFRAETVSPSAMLAVAIITVAVLFMSLAKQPGHA